MTATVQLVLMDTLEKVRHCSARMEIAAVSKVHSRS